MTVRNSNAHIPPIDRDLDNPTTALSLREGNRTSGRRARDRLLKVAEAADALGLSHKTLRDWIGARRCLVIRLGRAIRIPESEVDRIIEAGTVPARRAGK